MTAKRLNHPKNSKAAGSDKGTVAKVAVALILGLAAPDILPVFDIFSKSDAFAADEPYTISAAAAALAPNAGGQDAYALRVYNNNWEYGAFSNQYIMAGNAPLTGVTVDRRFAFCGEDCWWRFYTQAGGGFSNGGPIAQISWGTIIPAAPLWLPRSAPRYYPSIRLDFTTQFIFIRWRAVTWSYPLWAGVSISI